MPHPKDMLATLQQKLQRKRNEKENVSDGPGHLTSVDHGFRKNSQEFAESARGCLGIPADTGSDLIEEPLVLLEPVTEGALTYAHGFRRLGLVSLGRDQGLFVFKGDFTLNSV